MAAMETLSQAITRLEQAGYTETVSARDDGKLQCSGCDTVCDATDMTVDEIVRFEGATDPDDQAALFALDCGSHKSLYTVAFGPDTPPNDVVALRALSDAAR